MKKKTKTPEEKLQELSDSIEERIARWNHLNEKGGSDPLWPDGSNMNLVRNHIIYYKKQMRKICEENGLMLPDAYFLGTPPEVDNGYMANLKQQDRVKRLRDFGENLTRTRAEYNPA